MTNDVAKFVVIVLPEARFKHWNENEVGYQVIIPVAIAMPYYLPPRFTGPYTTLGDIDPSIAHLVNTHMAYSVPTDHELQQPE
jgi:hypothetical protein